MPTPPPDSIWNFSVALWAEPGVEGAALRLQDRHGLDVGLLLYCLWAARTQAAPVGHQSLALALAASRPWRDEIIGPLRRVRRRLKSAAGLGPGADLAALAKAAAAAELAAERQLLEVLERQSPKYQLAVAERDAERITERARQNMLDYLALAAAEGIRVSPDEIGAEIAFLARASAAVGAA